MLFIELLIIQKANGLQKKSSISQNNFTNSLFLFMPLLKENSYHDLKKVYYIYIVIIIIIII